MALPATEDPTGPPVVVGRTPAREEAERELSRRIYAEHEPGPARRLWNWLWDHIFGVLEEAAFGTPGGWLGLLVIALLITALLVALRLRLGALRTAAGPGRTGGLFADDRPRTAAEHRAAAAAHAAAQRWTPAVQERLRAVVRSLEERALLEPRPGRTANEAAAEAARPMPGHAQALRSAAARFDAVTYGGRAADAEDYRTLSELDEALLRTRPALDPAAPAWTAP
ncbi:DUF4129 domain-containing protein [Streptomyces sp. DSM 44917]|uniref:DUF4129 domain-containing protein n=1 Tax=Streptomyces boetiae TaxID=3075541 RepID=A0ABU2LFE5_9ACTN|nr:DUF4129 domain-containing protein [Streptomyces sp. DSM 44917]MDT0309982.1 DUF4129 domain-containing protein [Streptomyces sp. DSM 44917]